MNLDDLRKDYDIVPIARELSADAITPVAAFAALSGDGEAFLFESAATLSSASSRAAACASMSRRAIP
jgi:hypothetical protein